MFLRISTLLERALAWPRHDTRGDGAVARGARPVLAYERRARAMRAVRPGAQLQAGAQPRRGARRMLHRARIAEAAAGARAGARRESDQRLGLPGHPGGRGIRRGLSERSAAFAAAARGRAGDLLAPHLSLAFPPLAYAPPSLRAYVGIRPRSPAGVFFHARTVRDTRVRPPHENGWARGCERGLAGGAARVGERCARAAAALPRDRSGGCRGARAPATPRHRGAAARQERLPAARCAVPLRSRGHALPGCRRRRLAGQLAALRRALARRGAARERRLAARMAARDPALQRLADRARAGVPAFPTEPRRSRHDGA